MIPIGRRSWHRAGTRFLRAPTTPGAVADHAKTEQIRPGPHRWRRGQRKQHRRPRPKPGFRPAAPVQFRDEGVLAEGVAWRWIRRDLGALVVFVPDVEFRRDGGKNLRVHTKTCARCRVGGDGNCHGEPDRRPGVAFDSVPSATSEVFDDLSSSSPPRCGVLSLGPR